MGVCGISRKGFSSGWLGGVRIMNFKYIYIGILTNMQEHLWISYQSLIISGNYRNSIFSRSQLIIKNYKFFFQRSNTIKILKILIIML